ncbi:MAG TPA: cytochrome c3 family protein [Blastocatellia bacterium]|nr:cytochrome c3 family protein [Blastocatellia bacterium]
MLIKRLLVLVFVFALGGYAYAQYTGDGSKSAIVGTNHDLRSEFSGATAVCEFCHAPHKLSNPTITAPLLWNVQVKTGSYGTYSSSTLDATDVRNPASASSANSAAFMSLLCLSCHDGTVTEAAFYNREGLGGSGSFSPPNIGEQSTAGLTNDHPVDFTYSAALATADGGLATPTEGTGVRVPYVGSGANSLPLFKDASTDASGRLECATCHNPHNNANDPFLRRSNGASALCTSCHT